MVDWYNIGIIYNLIYREFNNNHWSSSHRIWHTPFRLCTANVYFSQCLREVISYCVVNKSSASLIIQVEKTKQHKQSTNGTITDTWIIFGCLGSCRGDDQLISTLQNYSQALPQWLLLPLLAGSGRCCPPRPCAAVKMYNGLSFSVYLLRWQCHLCLLASGADQTRPSARRSKTTTTAAACQSTRTTTATTTTAAWSGHWLLTKGGISGHAGEERERRAGHRAFLRCR